MTAFSVFAQVDQLTTACGPPEEAGAVCEGMFRLTGNESIARISDLFVARPLKIALVLALAWLTAHVVRRAIRRFTKGLGTVSAEVVTVADRVTVTDRVAVTDGSAGSLLGTGGTKTLRGVQRAETIGALLGSIAGFAIWGIAALMVLGELGVELGPLLAGAGIVGVAVGFGAQNLVRDFLSGIFMLIEDQYGVGDVIDAGPASGTVEGVSLRTTRLRDIEGNLWHIPNGFIDRVSNKSHEWSRALLDIPVAYGTDTDRATVVIKEVADATWRDEEWAGDILAEPEVWGVEAFGEQQGGRVERR